MAQRRSKQQWLDLLNQQQSSGLSAADFCRKNNISSKRFYYHASKTRKPKQTDAKASVFWSAKVANDKSLEFDHQAIRFKNGANELFLPATISPRWIAELITALT
jgi:hypothetical protein